MRKYTLCFIGYAFGILFNALLFVVDVLTGTGGSGKLFVKVWIISLIVTGLFIFLGTMKYLKIIFPKTNILLLGFSSIILGVIQFILIEALSFIINIGFLAAILIDAGFYVTMP